MGPKSPSDPKENVSCVSPTNSNWACELMGHTLRTMEGHKGEGTLLSLSPPGFCWKKGGAASQSQVGSKV